MEIAEKNNYGVILLGLPSSPVLGTLAVDSSDNLLKKWNGSSWITISSTSIIHQPAYLSDVKSDGGNLGTSTATTWNVRNLNTLADPSGIVLNPGAFSGTGGSNSDIQLGAGSYIVEVWASAGHVGLTRLRLQNTSLNSTVCMGLSLYQPAPPSMTAVYPVYMTDYFTSVGTYTYQLQHYTSIASSLGTAVTNASDAEVEVYVQMKITKVA